LTTEPSKSRTLIVTAWIFLLLAAGLPRIIFQEVFSYQVSFNLASVIAAAVILIGLILTLIWNEVHGLRPFFLLFLVLVGIEWVVFGVIADGRLLWDGSLLRNSIGCDRCINGRVFRLVFREVHA